MTILLLLKKIYAQQTTYYEYFAKNAGIRVSSGDFIFVTNSDILLTKDLVQEIKKELKNDNKDDYFYRVRYRGDIQLDQEPSDNPRIIPNGDLLTGHLNGWGDPEQVLDLHQNLIHHGLQQQDPVLGLWSGDASMFSRNVMFNDATAYNESEYGHRTEKNQANMDSEILWNLYKRQAIKTIRSTILSSLSWFIQRKREPLVKNKV